LLETTDLAVDEIASEVGFESPSAFRERFNSVVGTSAASYRRTFGGGNRAECRHDVRASLHTTTTARS